MTFIFPNLFSRVLKYFKILITQTMPARAKWYFLTKIKHLSVNSLLWCSFLKGIRENKSWTYAMWLLRHLHCKQRLKHTAYMVDREDSLNGGHMGMGNVTKLLLYNIFRRRWTDKGCYKGVTKPNLSRPFYNLICWYWIKQGCLIYL